MSTSAAAGNHSYKVVEVVGSSDKGSDEAVRNAIADASDSLHHLAWFEVVNQRGHIEGGKVAHFQVTLKIGFRIEK